ncbi:hypothetical protein BDZ97DRAFT_1852621 [Flammula alnicola]|nr:hypothetical protein BDZ97DRAFT_1852621 [Flammula alnicola]
MPPILSNTVIEIDSSPEPAHPARARSTSKTRLMPARGASSRPNAKGKGKATARKTARAAMDTVIELTDSEPELTAQPPIMRKQRSQAQAGPSGSQPTQKRAQHKSTSTPNTLRPKSSGPSGSLENIPVASGSGSGAGPSTTASSSKKRKAPGAIPLFLQTQSDEENQPPLAPGARWNDEGGDGFQEEMMDVADGDWDPEFSNKPFPFDFFYEPNRPPRVRLAAAPQPQPTTNTSKKEATLPALVIQATTVANPDPPAAVAPAPVAVQIVIPAPAPAAPPNPLPQPQPQPQPHVVAAPAPEAQQQPQPEPAAAAVPPPESQQGDPPADPTSHAMAQILEVIPDVEPEYLLGLVQTHLPTFAGQTAEHVLGLLFEDGGYPRVAKKRKAVVVASDGEGAEAGDKGKGKEKDVDQARPNKKAKVDYASVERVFEGGAAYHERALIYLQTDFPFIPKPYLRRSLTRFRNFYAPTHLALAAEEQSYEDDPGRHRMYMRKSIHYNPARERRRLQVLVDEAFMEERAWLEEQLNLRRPEAGSAAADGGAVQDEAGDAGKGKGKEKAVDLLEEDEPLEDGTGIECQCCFSEYAFVKMVQCPEAHLFCSGCVSQYASTKLGEHDIGINCMHSSGCAQPFPASELRRVLSTKLMDLYERVKQQKEIEQADLEGLEECPFCEWKCVLEVSKEEEKLFRCGNEDGGCGEVSCRLCKQKDHLPKSCKEVEEDKHLDGRHAIEEAMTRALMRNCPKCQKAFIKEQGCNKMTCPNCRTLSCYVCRQVISGYEHFNQAPPGRASTSRKDAGKCLLWDQVEERHAAEVKAAADKAIAEYKRDHPDVDEKEIKVDLPVAPPRPNPVGAAGIAPPPYQPPANPYNYAAQAEGFAQQMAQAFNPFAPVLGAPQHGAAVAANFNFFADPRIAAQEAEAARLAQIRHDHAQVMRRRQQMQRDRQRELQVQQRQQREQTRRLQQQAAQNQLMADVAIANANFQYQMRMEQDRIAQELLARAEEERIERERLYQEALIRHREERARQVQRGGTRAAAAAAAPAPPEALPVQAMGADQRRRARR